MSAPTASCSAAIIPTTWACSTASITCAAFRCPTASRPRSDRKVLEFMIGHVGADRVVLGSDYPYDMGMLDCVDHVRGLSVPDGIKTAILHDTAQKLLPGGVA